MACDARMEPCPQQGENHDTMTRRKGERGPGGGEKTGCGGLFLSFAVQGRPNNQMTETAGSMLGSMVHRQSGHTILIQLSMSAAMHHAKEPLILTCLAPDVPFWLANRRSHVLPNFSSWNAPVILLASVDHPHPVFCLLDIVSVDLLKG